MYRKLSREAILLKSGSNDFGLPVGFVARVLVRLCVNDFHPVTQFRFQPPAQFDSPPIEVRPVEPSVIIMILKMHHPSGEILFQRLRDGIPRWHTTHGIGNVAADIRGHIRGVFFPRPRSHAEVRHDGDSFFRKRLAHGRQFSPSVRFRQAGLAKTTCTPCDTQIESTPTMKTDVIILGAGASLSAGFPTNKDLANYMIDGIAGREQYGSKGGRRTTSPANISQDIRRLWPEVAQSLRRSGFLSIDEYCEWAKEEVERVTWAKQLLRLALFDHSYFWFRNNDYRTFVETLFEPSTGQPNPAFTIINFNYDGLLGKMLTDGVVERCVLQKQQIPSPERLAAIAGGYYPHPTQNRDVPLGMFYPVAVESETTEVERFAHHMPHGTFTVVGCRGQLLSLQDRIYRSDGSPTEMEEDFLATYSTTPMIHFPWESGKRLEIHKNQYSHAAGSIHKAKRIHFIGLSGHPLLRHSLTDLFQFVKDESTLLSKEWHIATPDDQGETFLKLMECFLPDKGLSGDQKQLIRTDSLRRLKKYNSFAEWLKAKPHLKSI